MMTITCCNFNNNKIEFMYKSDEGGKEGGWDIGCRVVIK